MTDVHKKVEVDPVAYSGVLVAIFVSLSALVWSFTSPFCLNANSHSFYDVNEKILGKALY